MKQVVLDSMSDFDIYMNPQRLRLLHKLALCGAATPKELSRQLGISASSVQHHIKKLLELDLVELDHTEQINGITAHFYRPVPVSIHISEPLSREMTTSGQYAALMQGLSEITADFSARLAETQDGEMANAMSSTGIIYLTPEEAAAFQQQVADFMRAHSQPHEGSGTWEMAALLFPARDAKPAPATPPKS